MNLQSNSFESLPPLKVALKLLYNTFSTAPWFSPINIRWAYRLLRHYLNKTKSQLLQVLHGWLPPLIYCSRSHIKHRVWSLVVLQDGYNEQAGVKPQNGPGQNKYIMKTLQTWESRLNPRHVLNSEALGGGDKTSHIRWAAKQWSQPGLRILFPCCF